MVNARGCHDRHGYKYNNRNIGMQRGKVFILMGVGAEDFMEWVMF